MLWVLQASVSGKSRRAETALEDVGISIGPKTSRDRLLDLLGKHIKRKKVKCDLQPGPARRSQTSNRQVQQSMNVTNDDAKVSKCVGVTHHPEPGQEYENFERSALVDMLKVVGLNTQGMEKVELVRLCRVYHDLSEVLISPTYILI